MIYLYTDGMVNFSIGDLEIKAHISAFEELALGDEAIKKQQFAKALTHFQKSADMGVGAAMGQLGNMYVMGAGVERNLEKGMEWIKKGA